MQEKESILASMKRRALKLVDGLNSMEGVSCNNAQGAMYACCRVPSDPLGLSRSAISDRSMTGLDCGKTDPYA